MNLNQSNQCFLLSINFHKIYFSLSLHIHHINTYKPQFFRFFPYLTKLIAALYLGKRLEEVEGHEGEGAGDLEGPRDDLDVLHGFLQDRGDVTWGKKSRLSLIQNHFH